MIGLILRGKQIYDKFSKDEMTVYAAQASFFYHHRGISVHHAADGYDPVDTNDNKVQPAAGNYKSGTGQPKEPGLRRRRKYLYQLSRYRFIRNGNRRHLVGLPRHAEHRARTEPGIRETEEAKLRGDEDDLRRLYHHIHADLHSDAGFAGSRKFDSGIRRTPFSGRCRDHPLRHQLSDRAPADPHDLLHFPLYVCAGKEAAF